VQRSVRDSGPLRPRLRGGAGRALPPPLPVRARVGRTVRRASGPGQPV